MLGSSLQGARKEGPPEFGEGLVLWIKDLKHLRGFLGLGV